MPARWPTPATCRAASPSSKPRLPTAARLLGPRTQHAGICLQNIVGYRSTSAISTLADANAAEALAILGDSIGPIRCTYAMPVHTRATAQLARRNGRGRLAAGDARGRGRSTGVQGTGHEVRSAARTTIALALMPDGRLDDAAREIDAVAPHAAALAPTQRTDGARGTGARHACPPAE